MSLVEIALLLFAAAFLLIVAGALVMLLATLRLWRAGQRAEGGAVLILGPVPLVFATGERVARSLILLAVILTAFVAAVFLLLAWLLPALFRA